MAETTIEGLESEIVLIKNKILNNFDHEPVTPVEFSPFTSEVQKADFINKVEKAKEYILQGDIFQVVLSQRFKAEYSGNPFDFYRKLRIQNPSPYMYFIDFLNKYSSWHIPGKLDKSARR